MFWIRSLYSLLLFLNRDVVIQYSGIIRMKTTARSTVNFCIRSTENCVFNSDYEITFALYETVRSENYIDMIPTISQQKKEIGVNVRCNVIT